MTVDLDHVLTLLKIVKYSYVYDKGINGLEVIFPSNFCWYYKRIFRGRYSRVIVDFSCVAKVN